MEKAPCFPGRLLAQSGYRTVAEEWHVHDE
jgi:hypothetical protein